MDMLPGALSLNNFDSLMAPEALSAVTLKVLVALLPLAVAPMLLVFRLTLDAVVMSLPEKLTAKAMVLPALAVMVEPANDAPELSSLPELNWVLPKPAFNDGAVPAVKLMLLLAALPVALDRRVLPLTLI